MDTKQLAVILFVIAIVLSGISIVMSLGVGDFTPINCRDQVRCVGGTDSGSGQVSLTILPPPSGGTG